MDLSEANERVERLLGCLDEVITLLAQSGERRWADWMRTVRAEIEQKDAHGLRRLLQAYGGMGSFNDLVLSPADGLAAGSGEGRAINVRLDTLRSTMYSDITALLRALEA